MHQCCPVAQDLADGQIGSAALRIEHTGMSLQSIHEPVIAMTGCQMGTPAEHPEKDL